MKAPEHGGRWLAAALIVPIALAAVARLGRAGIGPNAPPTPVTQVTPHAAARRSLGIPHDWSHRHLIFSRPSSPAMAQRLEQEPRFRIQQAWRHLSAESSQAWMRALDAIAVQLGTAPYGKAGPIGFGRPLWGRRKTSLNADWSVNLGSGAKVGTGMYPAKYSFDPIGTPDCTNDFVVFNTSLNGSGSQASIVAYNKLYSGASACGTTGVPAVDWAYNTGGAIVTSVVLSADGSQIAFVQPLLGVANLGVLKWAPSTSVVQIPANRTFTGTVANASPTLTGPANTFSSADIGAIVTGTNIPTNTYIASFSSGTTATMSASATGSTSESVTIEDHLTTTAGYPMCMAPCMTAIPFVNNITDSKSSPFYDYTNDIIYVGDDNGYIHKFTGVFKGTPTEVTSSSNPGFAARTGTLLTGPVLDSGVSPSVLYVGDSDGELDAVLAGSSPSVIRSGIIGNNPPDIADSPVVDSVAGKIYVTVAASNDSSNNSEVFLFARGFGAGTKGSKAAIGSADSSKSIVVYDGDFDNTYYNSSNATGSLYVCGDAGGNPTLYQVQISAGTFPSNNVHTGPSLANANVTCSPITEVYNSTATGGPFDWIFLSVQSSGSLANCSSGGCVMNFTVTEWQASTTYSLSQEILDSNLNIQKVTTAGQSGSSQPTWNATSGGTTTDGANGLVWTNQGSMGASANASSAVETGGTSGIIIDNTSTSSGASQVYFSTLGSGSCGGGCGVQASQAGLH